MEQTYTKSVKQYGVRDYAAVVNGEEISFHTSAIAALTAADVYVYDQLQLDARSVDAGPAEVAAAPAAGLLVITREAVQNALVVAQQKCADDARWLRATARAFRLLDTNKWSFDGQRLVIASQSRNAVRHVVEPGRCDCESFQNGKPCTHRAAYRLLCAVVAGQSAQVAG